MRVITLFISVLVAAVVAVDPTDRCDQIIPGQLNAQELIRLSPYIIYLSTIGEYNCSTVQYVGPAGTDTSYTWTCIVINGASVITHDDTLKDNSRINSIRCSDGTLSDSKVLYANLYNTGNAWICVYACDNQGVNMEMLLCFGRTPQDAAYIEKYLDSQLTVPITGPVYYSQSNCPKPENCGAHN